MQFSEHKLNQIRDTEEYHIAREYVGKLIIKRKTFNKKVNSYGIKNYISNYMAKFEPDRYNYIGNEHLITAMMDSGFKYKKESCRENPNYLFNFNYYFKKI